MTIPKYAVPSGAIDGVNTVFSVGEAYTPGSVASFLNGLLVRRDDDDGWTESDPSTGEVTLTEAPRSTGGCDTVNIFYIDTTPQSPEDVLENIFGTLKPIDCLNGGLEVECDLTGRIDETDSLSGILDPEVPPLQGTIAETDRLVGVLQEDC